jgi:hypothetical protein
MRGCTRCFAMPAGALQHGLPKQTHHLAPHGRDEGVGVREEGREWHLHNTAKLSRGSERLVAHTGTAYLTHMPRVRFTARAGPGTSC